MTKPQSCWLGVVASLLLLVPSRPAEAEASFSVVSFRPTTDHGYYLNVEGSRTLGQWKFTTHLTGEFSDESLILVNAAGDKVRDIVQQQFTLHLGAALGFFDWLNMGFLISMVPHQKFLIPATGVRDNGFRMGDVTIDAKLRLLDHENYPLGIAIAPFVTIPSGSDSHFTGEGKVTGGGELVLETPRLADRFSFAINAGYLARASQALSQGTVIDDQFLYGAAANLAIVAPVEIIAEVTGWTKFENFFDEDFRPLVAQGGIRVFPHPKLALTAGGGAAVLKGMGAPTWRTFLTIGYTPAYHHYKATPCPDADGDGVCDRKDQCPTEAGGKENQGCPELPKIRIDEAANQIWHQKLYFEFDRAILKPESKPILDEMAASLNVRPDILHVTIIGHTDWIGSDAYNQGLSERRAKSCRDYLVEEGISPARLVHFGKGEGQPIDTNATREGRAKNRRVEFHIEMAPPEVVVVEPELTTAPPAPEPAAPPAAEPEVSETPVLEPAAGETPGGPLIAPEPPVTSAGDTPPAGGGESDNPEK